MTSLGPTSLIPISAPPPFMADIAYRLDGVPAGLVEGYLTLDPGMARPAGLYVKPDGVWEHVGVWGSAGGGLYRRMLQAGADYDSDINIIYDGSENTRGGELILAFKQPVGPCDDFTARLVLDLSALEIENAIEPIYGRVTFSKKEPVGMIRLTTDSRHPLIQALAKGVGEATFLEYPLRLVWHGHTVTI